MVVKFFPTLLPYFQGDRFSWLVPHSAFSIPASLLWFRSKVERNFAPSPLNGNFLNLFFTPSIAMHFDFFTLLTKFSFQLVNSRSQTNWLYTTLLIKLSLKWLITLVNCFAILLLSEKMIRDLCRWH